MSKSKKAAPAAPEPSPRIVTAGLYGDYELTRIRISPDNRKRFNEDALNELAESIKSIGIAQPILMRPVTPTEDAPEDFEIVAGERRFRASKIAGRSTIPAVVRELSDLDAAKLRILENLQREDPHPMEEAEGYQLLMLQHGYNADQLADEIKKSRAYVYGRLKLCALSTEVREEFLHDKISASTALLIARIPVPAMQAKALYEIIRPHGPMTVEPMSVRAAAEHIQRRYMLNLSTALFKITDAKLLASAGACGTCPKRTGNQPEIFEGISADVCTDPDCFGEKKAAHHDAMIVEADKKGIPVLEGAERQAIVATSWAPGGEFVTADENLYRFDRNAPATKNSGTALAHLGADGLPPVALLTKDALGEVRRWYKRTEMQTALEAAGACETVEQHAKRMAVVKSNAAPAPAKPKSAEQIEEEQRDLLAEQETQFRVALYKKLRAVGEGSGFSLESLREFTKLAVRNMPLPDDLLGDVYDFDASTDEKVFAYVDQAGLPAIQLLLIDLVVGESLAVSRHDIVRGAVRMPNNDFDAVIAMAKHQGIDPDDVREELFPTPINVDDATSASLAEFIAKYPTRINELKDAILPHPRFELIRMLEQVAENAGFTYTPEGFKKWAPVVMGMDLAQAGTDATVVLDFPLAAVADEVAVDGELLQEMMAEAAPEAKKKKGKSSTPKPSLEHVLAWPFPKTSASVTDPKPAAPPEPTDVTETTQEIAA